MDYNFSPYFNDNSPKNTSVLFKTNVPVQVRELNQIQSIFKQTIARFANHVFKSGSRVSGGATTDISYNYVAIDDLSPFDNKPVHQSIMTEGYTFKCQTSKLELKFIHFEKSKKVVGEDANLIYYVNDGSVAIDNVTTKPLEGEILEVYDENNILICSYKVRCPTCVTTADTSFTKPIHGSGTFFIVSDGTYYIDGIFTDVQRQIVLASKFNVPAWFGIGFDVVESIVSHEDDVSLYDNSLGYANVTEIGADRQKIELNLVVVDSVDFVSSGKYIPLCTVYRGEYNHLKADSEYNVIMDEIAKRTYDESGNYTVTPPYVRFMNDKAESATDANGLSVTGNDDMFVGVISPFNSYVKGYRYNKTVNSYVKIAKPRDTKTIKNYIHNFTPKTYVLLTPVVGLSVYPNNIRSKTLFDNSTVEIYNGLIDDTTKLPLGVKIGNCKIVDVSIESGTVGVDAVLRYTIAEIAMNIGYNIESARSFFQATNSFAANTVLNGGKFEVQNPNNFEMIWRLKKNHVKNLLDSNDKETPSFNFTQRKYVQGTVNTLGVCKVEAAPNEIFLPFDPKKTIGILTGSNTNADLDTAIDLTSGTTITSDGTTITIKFFDPQTQAVRHSGKTITLLTDVLTTNAQARTKQLVTETITGLAASNSNIKLNITDLYKIKSVIAVGAAKQHFDVTSYFDFDSGQRDHAYTNASIFVIAGKVLPYIAGYTLEITFEYFNHKNDGNFFSIDSYNKIIANEDIVFGYGDVPLYTSSKGVKYPLAFCVDFRPTIMTDVNSVETVTSISAYPSANTTAIFDIEYYLPRIDYICIDEKGTIFPEYGVPSEFPKPPKVKPGNMKMFMVNLGAYQYSLSDIKSKYIDNRRYTMRDINRIEDRIKNIEYYTALNLVEKSAADMAIKDASGKDKFKNGFIADNFENFQAGDLLSNEFKAAINKRGRELRPRFKSRNKKLKLKTPNANLVKRSSVVMLDYDHVEVMKQPFATKHISINPYFKFTQTGKMLLTPNNDTWADTTRLPNLEFTIDTGTDVYEHIAEASGILGTQWGEWSELNNSVISDTIIDENDGIPPTSEATPDAHAIETNYGEQLVPAATPAGFTDHAEIRLGTRTEYSTENTMYELGDRVTDVGLKPYCRSIDIEFHCSGLIPNLQVYAFFDDEAVSEFCTQILGDAVVPMGTQMVTDSSGIISGIFKIPEGRFFAGQTEFKIIGDPANTGDPDLTITQAKSVFFAGGIDLTKQNTGMGVITPMIEITDLVETKIVRVANPPPPPPPAPADPIAQSFKMDKDCFISGFDVFMKQYDTNSKTIYAQIRTMKNGYPTDTVLTEKIIRVSDILSIKSETSTVALPIRFDFPAYVSKGKEYCFVIGGWSPDTRIWVAKLGDKIVNIPDKTVETQPSEGSSFRSQNGSTWNAEQYEDIKFTLYAAKFKSNTAEISFEQEFEFEQLKDNPIETEAGSMFIRVYQENHGNHAGDKVVLNVSSNIRLTVNCSSVPMVGQILSQGANTGTITTVIKTGVDLYSINVDRNTGHFVNGAFTVASLITQPTDTYLTGDMGIPTTPITRPGFTGVITAVETLDVNGLVVDELNKQHTVFQADSTESFIIQLTSPAAETGLCGGSSVSVDSNTKFDVFNVAGAYLPYSSTETWNLKGLGHNHYPGVDETVGIFAATDYVYNTVKFLPFTDTYLESPMKIANAVNEGIKTVSSVTVTAKFISPSEWLSPVINTDTFSLTNISNQIEFISEAAYEHAPNLDRFVAETANNNGSETYKYVTKNIVLKNPAKDLMLYFDAFKDFDADFRVYFRGVTSEKINLINDVPWQEVKINKVDSENNSRIEYEASISESIVGWVPDTMFAAFAVKIVGNTYNSAKPVTFQSFRAIAVT